MARCCRARQLENFRFHDLRHSTTSYLAINGTTLAEITAILGHKTVQMVERYNHIAVTMPHPWSSG
ncbi:MAG: tyrosine-type recombinase/integrase [Pseudomonadota bacterium]|nr:MAG: tyrosine-type recombinase/integrase [Pseudomonadota bacterium]